MTEQQQIEEELRQIQVRNKRVEADKAWETSWFRRALLVVLTYVVIGLFMQAVRIQNPWISAVVPSLGFILSTLSLEIIKKIWLKHLYRRQD